MQMQLKLKLPGRKTKTQALKQYQPQEKDNPVRGYEANVLITLCRAGKLKEAMRRLYQGSTEINSTVLATMFQACGKIGVLPQGKFLHAHVIEIGFKPTTFLWNNILNMYVKCGKMEDAYKVFDKMPHPCVVSWTSMITAFSQNGKAYRALELFQQMQDCGIDPNPYTFSGVIKACASLGRAGLDHGRQVHDAIMGCGLEMDVVVMNALVDMYAKCGSIEHARQVFDEMLERNVVSWNSMIMGYCQRGDVDEAVKLFMEMPEPDMVSCNAMIAGFSKNDLGEKALEFYCQMQEAGIRPDKYVFASVLRACASLTALEHGKQIHAHIIVTGLESDIMGATALVDMYAKCTRLEDAEKLFSTMSEHGVHDNTRSADEVTGCDSDKPNIVSWNAMVAGYSQNGRGEEALKLFCQMRQENLDPDHFTFGSVLKACSSLTNDGKGKQIHAHIIKSGNESDVIVGSALVNMYAKCKNMEAACKVFEVLPERDAITWTTMIVGCAQHGWNDASVKYFGDMLQKCIKPDQFTIASALSACANLAALELGKQVHAHFIVSGFESNDIARGALIDMYTKCGSIVDAQMAFDEILRPNSVIQPSMDAGYAHHGQGDVVVGSALVDMYSKCGDIENAYRVFRKLKEPDVVSWTAMIAGLAQHGQGIEALKVFQKMLRTGVKPNEITFVGVFSACSHAGLVDQGLDYFDSMTRDYGISPMSEHYSCVVDLLGRAGYLQEAYNFITRMHVEHDSSVWGTLLGACREHGNMYLGKCAAEHLLELKENDATTYVVLANIYAAMGSWDDVSKVRYMMKVRGIKKQPGCSWIEIKNKVYTFVVETWHMHQMDSVTFNCFADNTKKLLQSVED